MRAGPVSEGHSGSLFDADGSGSPSGRSASREGAGSPTSLFPAPEDREGSQEAAGSRPRVGEGLRPRTLDEVIGQAHLLGPGKPLRVAFEAHRVHSMSLWGPPGVGKTTLARLVAGAVDAQFIVLSAVLAGVKEIREAVDRARAVRQQGRATVVFVDEVHRFNKAQ